MTMTEVHTHETAKLQTEETRKIHMILSFGKRKQKKIKFKIRELEMCNKNEIKL